MTSAAEIARGLTKAHRLYLLKAKKTADGRWLVESNSITKVGAWPQGLTEYYSWALDRLTPLGLAVRTILEAKDHE